ncbi:UDP-xylose and UDP-N-acetylglucosamine transporter [Thrips palmi]|uniref:UDP-xylose and UDP-N-acetylglucosamine transporter n=1 Tax=Thrips palmi TaxID=161013 RepID=A0A6P9A2L1_THRPL|nr:UDP-xylose and UDP-N-acetylglucosamine transporter [Thrips palmi]
MHPGIPIAGVFIGCGINVVFLELLVKQDPGSGNLVTFTSFFSIALIGFAFTAKFGTVKPKIGLRDYFILVLMFFASSLCNNYAFNFNIPMPLHMIFRAGSLIANMIMGIIILKKKYTLSKYLSVAMISLGIVICTIMSSTEVKSTVPPPKDGSPIVPTTPYEDMFWWTLGIILLTVALFISARMGIYQEVLFARYGKHSQEALLYTHLLPLPLFLLLGGNLWEHMSMAIDSDPYEITGLGFTIPIMVLYLIGNVVSQYLCISSVYRLTTECSSLTVTLVLTLRKFGSLVFSLVYFKNPFTVAHWIGTILVFLGTLIFTEVPQKALGALSPAEGKKEKEVKEKAKQKKKN